MKVLIDASAIIAVIFNEPTKSSLIKLTRATQLIAPESIHWEIGNAISCMFKMKKIGLDASLKALLAYQKIPISFIDVGIEDAVKIAHEFEIYAYDAYLLTCARHHQSKLLSLDKKLVRLAKQMSIEVLEVSP